jgi:Uma2 family endonuclease
MAVQAVHTAAVPRWRFTVDEYYRMAKAGILGEDDRVELIDGELIKMSPIGSRHAAAVSRCNYLFQRAFGDRAIVNVQNPVRLDPYSEPQPDVALLRPQPDFYARAHPGARDVLLIIEVVDTSARYDRLVKLPAYARFGIPEVWLLHLPRGWLEVHRDPSPDGYRQVRRYRRGERVSPLAFPDVAISVDDLLGR